MPDVTGQEGQTIPEEVVSEARNLGWRPKEEFRGDPEEWVDADTFVQRGRSIMPILKQNNQRLSAQLAETNTKLQGALAVIEELKELGATITKERVAAAKKELLAQLTQAKKEGNIDLEVELTDQLSELRSAPAPAPKPAAAPAAPTDGLDPEFVAWQNEPGNEWFGVDRRKTMLAMGIAQELRADPNFADLRGKAFFRKVGQEVAKTLGGSAASPAPDRVGGSARSTPSGSGASPGGKGYANLPPEAKEACDRQAKRFVGTAAFKTEADYRAHYTKIYFAGE